MFMSVFCDKGVRGIEHGKEALAAGGPPPRKWKHGCGSRGTRNFLVCRRPGRGGSEGKPK